MVYVVYYNDGSPRHPGIAYEGKSYYKASRVLASYREAYGDVWMDELEDEDVADDIIRAYYRNEFDLPTCHEKLRALFGSKKQAVEYFA